METLEISPEYKEWLEDNDRLHITVQESIAQDKAFARAESEYLQQDEHLEDESK